MRNNAEWLLFRTAHNAKRFLIFNKTNKFFVTASHCQSPVKGRPSVLYLAGWYWHIHAKSHDLYYISDWKSYFSSIINSSNIVRLFVRYIKVKWNCRDIWEDMIKYQSQCELSQYSFFICWSKSEDYNFVDEWFEIRRKSCVLSMKPLQMKIFMSLSLRYWIKIIVIWFTVRRLQFSYKARFYPLKLLFWRGKGICF